MKNNFGIILLFTLVIMLFSAAGVQASALGQLQQQAAGQNCFDKGCSGAEGNQPQSNDLNNYQAAAFSNIWEDFRKAGTNFFSNIPTLMKKFSLPLFAKFN